MFINVSFISLSVVFIGDCRVLIGISIDIVTVIDFVAVIIVIFRVSISLTVSVSLMVFISIWLVVFGFVGNYNTLSVKSIILLIGVKLVILLKKWLIPKDMPVVSQIVSSIAVIFAERVVRISNWKLLMLLFTVEIVPLLKIVLILFVSAHVRRLMTLNIFNLIILSLKSWLYNLKVLLYLCIQIVPLTFLFVIF